MRWVAMLGARWAVAPVLVAGTAGFLAGQSALPEHASSPYEDAANRAVAERAQETRDELYEMIVEQWRDEQEARPRYLLTGSGRPRRDFRVPPGVGYMRAVGGRIEFFTEHGVGVAPWMIYSDEPIAALDGKADNEQ